MVNGVGTDYKSVTRSLQYAYGNNSYIEIVNPGMALSIASNQNDAKYARRLQLVIPADRVIDVEMSRMRND